MAHDLQRGLTSAKKEMLERKEGKCGKRLEFCPLKFNTSKLGIFKGINLKPMLFCRHGGEIDSQLIGSAKC